MNIAKLQQNIKDAEEALSRMKEELKKAQEMDSKDYYPESSSVPFNVDNCIKVIDGYIGALPYAFKWHFASPGYPYWKVRADGKTPLSNEDKITLLRWCVNYYRAQEKK